MTRILLLETVASTYYAYTKGKEVDAPDDVARDLIKAGHAVEAGLKTAGRSVENAASKIALKAEKR